MQAKKTLKLLKQGNQVYLSHFSAQTAMPTQINKTELEKTQKPIAAILACSDSRVPVELIFNQGVGDLFVVRVAGNIATTAQIASIEVACQKFGIELVVVLGHSNCEAVKATLNSLRNKQQPLSPHLGAVCDCIAPAIEPLIAGHEKYKDDALLQAAITANAQQTVGVLKSESELLSNRIKQGTLTIQAAQYSLNSGKVDFDEVSL